jgi:myo-inositol-1(or 4)-monophosphatase
MVEAARAAARPMMRDFGESEQLRYSVKGNKDYVTQTDLRSEKIICQKLSEARPTFDILSEECGLIKAQEREKRQRQWIIDPLDGTKNFIHGFPFFAISIAAKEDDEIFAGVIYAPIFDEMFVAERWQGAYMNDRRIRASNCTEVGKSLLAYGRLGAFREKFVSILQKGPNTRQLGSVALAMAWTATARLDGFITGEAALWDVAAASVILQEAGAMVTSPDGKKAVLKGDKIAITAANQTLHGKLVQ